MIVVDTGPLVAAIDADDDHHGSCAELVRTRYRELVVPATVVVEVCWLLDRHVGAAAEAGFLRSLAHGTIRVENVLPSDYERMAELVDTYSDLRLGMVDASVVAVAERLGIASVFTINRRDFSVVRPRHVAAFDLLP